MLEKKKNNKKFKEEREKKKKEKCFKEERKKKNKKKEKCGLEKNQIQMGTSCSSLSKNTQGMSCDRFLGRTHLARPDLGAHAHVCAPPI